MSIEDAHSSDMRVKLQVEALRKRRADVVAARGGSVPLSHESCFGDYFKMKLVTETSLADVIALIDAITGWGSAAGMHKFATAITLWPVGKTIPPSSANFPDVKECQRNSKRNSKEYNKRIRKEYNKRIRGICLGLNCGNLAAKKCSMSRCSACCTDNNCPRH